MVLALTSQWYRRIIHTVRVRHYRKEYPYRAPRNPDDIDSGKVRHVDRPQENDSKGEPLNKTPFSISSNAFPSQPSKNQYDTANLPHYTDFDQEGVYKKFLNLSENALLSEKQHSILIKHVDPLYLRKSPSFFIKEFNEKLGLNLTESNILFKSSSIPNALSNEVLILTRRNFNALDLSWVSEYKVRPQTNKVVSSNSLVATSLDERETANKLEEFLRWKQYSADIDRLGTHVVFRGGCVVQKKKTFEDPSCVHTLVSIDNVPEGYSRTDLINLFNGRFSGVYGDYHGSVLLEELKRDHIVFYNNDHSINQSMISSPRDIVFLFSNVGEQLPNVLIKCRNRRFANLLTKLIGTEFEAPEKGPVYGGLFGCVFLRASRFEFATLNLPNFTERFKKKTSPVSLSGKSNRIEPHVISPSLPELSAQIYLDSYKYLLNMPLYSDFLSNSNHWLALSGWSPTMTVENLAVLLFANGVHPISIIGFDLANPERPSSVLKSNDLAKYHIHNRIDILNPTENTTNLTSGRRKYEEKLRRARYLRRIMYEFQTSKNGRKKEGISEEAMGDEHDGKYNAQSDNQNTRESDNTIESTTNSASDDTIESTPINTTNSGSDDTIESTTNSANDDTIESTPINTTESASDDTIESTNVNTTESASDDTIEPTSINTTESTSDDTIEPTSINTTNSASDDTIESTPINTTNSGSDDTIEPTSINTTNSASDNTIEPTSINTTESTSDDTIEPTSINTTNSASDDTIESATRNTIESSSENTKLSPTDIHNLSEKTEEIVFPKVKKHQRYQREKSNKSKQPDNANHFNSTSQIFFIEFSDSHTLKSQYANLSDFCRRLHGNIGSAELTPSIMLVRMLKPYLSSWQDDIPNPKDYWNEETGYDEYNCKLHTLNRRIDLDEVYRSNDDIEDYFG